MSRVCGDCAAAVAVAVVGGGIRKTNFPLGIQSDIGGYHGKIRARHVPCAAVICLGIPTDEGIPGLEKSTHVFQNFDALSLAISIVVQRDAPARAAIPVVGHGIELFEHAEVNGVDCRFNALVVAHLHKNCLSAGIGIGNHKRSGSGSIFEVRPVTCPQK